MGFVSEALPAIFRWLHIFAGIIWIGHLFFFNWVNGAFAATMDADTKKKVVPELMPRALFWFRWGALWTWVTGILLLLLVFYHGGIMFEGDAGWGVGAIVMVLLVYVSPFIYDALAKSPLAKNKKVFAVIMVALVGVVMYLMSSWAGLSYRSYNIHIGAIFGTIMAYNVWFRIWPLQQKIINVVKAGQKPEDGWVAMAGGRSRHNTYLSVPLVWTMINQHTTYFSGGNLGIPTECAWVVMLVITAIGWHIVWHCYNKSAKVKGF